MLNSITERVSASPCYAILIDETMDITTTEQLVIYIKYIHVNSAVADWTPTVRTQFLGLVEVCSIFSVITNLILYNLDFSILAITL